MDMPDKEALKKLLQEWINERHQALLEQVMMTWQEGMSRLNPDEALAERVLELLPAPVLPDAFGEGPVDTDQDLGTALDLIESATGQGEALKLLLSGLQAFAERSAIFVMKQGVASLYASKGFESDAPRVGSPVVPPPELDEMIQGRVGMIDRPGVAYAALLGPLSKFEASGIVILPLRLRRKIVALLLVDSGLRQVVDHPHHVRALAHATEAVLGFLAGQKEEEGTRPGPPAEIPPSAVTMRVPEAIAEPAAATLDPKVRANAERSARVLVSDIELYFPAKAEQARKNGNLYGLLRDELDRSRLSFVERYGEDVELQYRIFYQTVLQMLCDGDPSKLGAAPWAPSN